MVVRLVANQNTRVRFPLPAQANENTPLIRGVFSFALVGAGIEPKVEVFNEFAKRTIIKTKISTEFLRRRGDSRFPLYRIKKQPPILIGDYRLNSFIFLPFFRQRDLRALS